MNSEKVKEIKELLRCMNGEKPCTNCYINDIAEEQGTFCINVVADMTLDLINELERENERLLDSVETVQSNRCVFKCELTKKQLKQFAERLKIECVNKIHETLKEFLGE